jgi:hypothetical protein
VGTIGKKLDLKGLPGDTVYCLNQTTVDPDIEWWVSEISITQVQIDEIGISYWDQDLIRHDDENVFTFKSDATVECIIKNAKR